MNWYTLINLSWSDINGLSFYILSIDLYDREFNGSLFGFNTDFHRYFYLEIFYKSFKLWDKSI